MLDQLLKHIQIDEETQNRDNKIASMPSTKVDNIESSTKNNTRNYTGGKNKRKFNKTIIEKSNKSCYFCGKKGHFKRDWKFKKKLKFGNSDTTNKQIWLNKKIMKLLLCVDTVFCPSLVSCFGSKVQFFFRIQSNFVHVRTIQSPKSGLLVIGVYII